MDPKQDYSQLVLFAEKAVSGIKDPELRRIAFQKILDDLLSQGSSGIQRSSKAKALHPSSAKSSSKSSSSKKRSGGTAVRLAELIEDNFFQKPKTLAQVKAELENLGHHIPMTALSGPLQRACQKRLLRRQKIKTIGKKQTYAYSNW